MLPIESQLSVAAQKAEEALSHWLAMDYSGDTALAEAMRYSTLGGGKRIRAFLTLSFCRLFGGTDTAAMPFAAAIEMVHAYSLIHDDLPCMDNDDMRRGKPSCHKAFGEAYALLAGDALLTQAFEVAASNDAVSDRSVRLAVKELARGAGALGMAGGQFYDLSETCASYEELVRLQRMKTGALIRAASLMGYYAASDMPDAKVVFDITEYAENIGFAFQIIDDLLDVCGDEAVLGKPIGSDAKNGKKTVLTYRSADQARQLAVLCTQKAEEAIRPYSGSDVLCAFAEYLMNRKN